MMKHPKNDLKGRERKIIGGIGVSIYQRKVRKGAICRNKLKTGGERKRETEQQIS